MSEMLSRAALEARIDSLGSAVESLEVRADEIVGQARAAFDEVDRLRAELEHLRHDRPPGGLIAGEDLGPGDRVRVDFESGIVMRWTSEIREVLTEGSFEVRSTLRAPFGLAAHA